LSSTRSTDDRAAADAREPATTAAELNRTTQSSTTFGNAPPQRRLREHSSEVAVRAAESVGS
jgi:hypothetical protein